MSPARGGGAGITLEGMGCIGVEGPGVEFDAPLTFVDVDACPTEACLRVDRQQGGALLNRWQLDALLWLLALLERPRGVQLVDAKLGVGQLPPQGARAALVSEQRGGRTRGEEDSGSRGCLGPALVTLLPRSPSRRYAAMCLRCRS